MKKHIEPANSTEDIDTDEEEETEEIPVLEPTDAFQGKLEELPEPEKQILNSHTVKMTQFGNFKVKTGIVMNKYDLNEMKDNSVSLKQEVIDKTYKKYAFPPYNFIDPNEILGRRLS